MEIGTLLDLEDHILSRIKADESKVTLCLRAVLSEWLKRINPIPTWDSLVVAVSPLNQSIAEDIKKRVGFSVDF